MDIKYPNNFNLNIIPHDPGVYLFKDCNGVVIYCGKAKNLRNRVSNYFQNPSQLPIKTVQLMKNAHSVDWIIVHSEVEALLLENKLIKQYNPKYNINLKDAKTFAYIALTKETYPRVMSTRKLNSQLEAFGPYTDGTKRREVQKLVVTLFKLRTCKTLPKHACLNYHIGICTAPCIENVSKHDYTIQVENARSFMHGGYLDIEQKLKKQMLEASSNQEYEKAIIFKNQIESIKMLQYKQVVDNDRKFNQDIIAIKTYQHQTSIVHMSIQKGVLLGKRDFSIDYQENVLQEFIKAYYSNNPVPREIILSQKCWIDDEEKSALEEFLSNLKGGVVVLIVPVKGDKHKLIELGLKNIESNMEHNGALLDLKNAINLSVIPLIIESFDVSNLGREHVVCGMVRFVNAKANKSGYRKFLLKTTDGQNDFAGIKEAVYRRYKRLLSENMLMPDLILIDGGKEQLSSALDALRELGIQLPVIGLAKRLEEIYLPGQDNPKLFDKNSQMMLLLRQIRDETHHFAISYNKKRREIKMRDEFK